MRQVVVKYKVKPDRAAENEELARSVYEELHRDHPAGLRYATFRLEDGVSFLHVAWNETEDGRNVLREVQAFKEFEASLADRLEEGPVLTEIETVGSYRFLGDAG